MALSLVSTLGSKVAEQARTSPTTQVVQSMAEALEVTDKALEAGHPTPHRGAVAR
jgi:hypothetical protein